MTGRFSRIRREFLLCGCGCNRLRPVVEANVSYVVRRVSSYRETRGNKRGTYFISQRGHRMSYVRSIEQPNCCRRSSRNVYIYMCIYIHRI